VLPAGNGRAGTRVLRTDDVLRRKTPSRGAAWGCWSCRLNLGLLSWAARVWELGATQPYQQYQCDTHHQIAHVLAITKNTNLRNVIHSTGFCSVASLRSTPSYEMGVALMQAPMIAGLVLGVAVSATWTAFLGFELFRLIELMF